MFKNPNNLPNLPGVYLFKDVKKNVLYVGKAKDLKKRVKSYFQKQITNPKINHLLPTIKIIDHIVVSSDFEALLLESLLIKKLKPKYNVILKDDKHYIYIQITKEEFPRVLYARRTDQKSSDFFGPFPSAGAVRQIMHILRRIFPYCNQKRQAKRACLYHHIGLCDPCPAEIIKLGGNPLKEGKARYQKNIRRLKLILNGNIDIVKDDLIKDMKKQSDNQAYESAQRIKKKLEQLKYVTHNYHSPDSYLVDKDNINKIRFAEELDLKDRLSIYYKDLVLPKTIECYDISNISGKFASGSLVTFIDGDPAKKFYRRFRIRTKSTPDDFAMLDEVLKRRLTHQNWPLPDLFVVDGGKPQVSTFSKILLAQKIYTPAIGLAKRDEEIIILKEGLFYNLKLKKGTPALSLVERIRDEAHRFAHKYHEHLRLKYLLRTVGKN